MLCCQPYRLHKDSPPSPSLFNLAAYIWAVRCPIAPLTVKLSCNELDSTKERPQPPQMPQIYRDGRSVTCSPSSIPISRSTLSFWGQAVQELSQIQESSLWGHSENTLALLEAHLVGRS
jgi:hypothetical protein